MAFIVIFDFCFKNLMLLHICDKTNLNKLKQLVLYLYLVFMKDDNTKVQK